MEMRKYMVIVILLVHFCWRIIDSSDNFLFDWPVAEPGHRGNPGLIQPVVSQRNYVQILGLIENCLWDFLNQVVFQIQLLNDSQKSRKQEPNVWYHARTITRMELIPKCHTFLLFKESSSGGALQLCHLTVVLTECFWLRDLGRQVSGLLGLFQVVNL